MNIYKYITLYSVSIKQIVSLFFLIKDLTSQNQAVLAVVMIKVFCQSHQNN